MQTAVAAVESPDRALSLLKPVRHRILELCQEPTSATRMAVALGMPRQRVGYHVRALEDSGLLRHVGDERRGNCVEHLVQASARRYVISPAALGALGANPDAIRDRFSSDYLIAVAAKTVREVGTLQNRALEAAKKLPTLTLQTEVRFASPTEQQAFAEELANSVADLVRKYHRRTDERGRTFRFVMGGYPAIDEDDES